MVISRETAEAAVRQRMDCMPTERIDLLQVQFSLIDTRPLSSMVATCDKHAVKLLTYGALIDKAEPDPYSGTLNPSQRKYLDMIVSLAWGTWALFQDLLRVLRVIGDRHGGLSISNVATRWVLDHPVVRVWAVRSIPETISRSSGLLEDRSDIDTVFERSNSARLFETIGDCGAEYR
ncbi:hypothetical protein C8J57DRAFT_1501235 [Mycena rebaudengoi]|nr:hypothetical protein C8J57DRAFT_1501235 [Mycena rebaudengoi]